MKVKMISKNVVVIMITSLIILMASMTNYSNATVAGFISFNNAPRKYLTINDSKLADITIKIEDNNGISYAKLYKITDAKGTKKEIKFSSANTSNPVSHIYTMSHKNMLKGKEGDFYIEAKDKTGNVLKSTFKIVVKSKQVTVKKKVYDKKKKKNVTKSVKETVKYYDVNDSPRVINWVASGNKVTVGIKDNDGTKVAKIQDMNNNNKEIYTLKNLAKGEARVTLDMTKFKANNKTYKLKFITEDVKGHESRRIVFFDMNVTQPKVTTKKETTTKKTEAKKEATAKKTTTKKSTSNKTTTNKTTAKKSTSQKTTTKKTSTKATNQTTKSNKLKLKSNIIKLEKGKATGLLESKKTAGQTITWTTSNAQIASVNKSGKVRGLKDGTVTITATTNDNQTAQCKVTVKTISDKKINKTLTSSDLKRVMTVSPRTSSCTVAQGFCVTENYFVCALVNRSDSKTSLQIYDKKTKKLKNKITGNLDHANGMAYNPNNQKIYVANCRGSKYSVLPVDNTIKGKSLRKSTKHLPTELSSITYDPYTNQYYAGKGDKFYVYDSNLKSHKKYSKKICHTTQDVGAYKGLILVIDYNMGTKSNAIDIYRASNGKYLGRYKVNLSSELESIQYDQTNKCFYLYCNTGDNGIIYKTTKINLDKYYL